MVIFEKCDTEDWCMIMILDYKCGIRMFENTEKVVLAGRPPIRYLYHFYAI